MNVLYGRHSVRIYRFALRLVGEESTAEDIVSEVFLDVWRKASSFQGRSQVSTWLLGITRHKALEALRRRPAETAGEEALETAVDTADDPETAMQGKQRASIVSACLQKLSPAHREIVDLVYYHGKSIDEVALIIGVPRNTVKTRMFYARAHLAKLLHQAGIGRALLAAW